jgi:hypothetical protein
LKGALMARCWRPPSGSSLVVINEDYNHGGKDPH